MSLVDRLRNPIAFVEYLGFPGGGPSESVIHEKSARDAMIEAADEIERLRGLLRRAQYGTDIVRISDTEVIGLHLRPEPINASG